MNTKKDLVKKEETALAPSMDFGALMAQDAQNNSGFEGIGTEDLAIPFILILQALSPQLRGPGKIEGAKEGMLYNNVTKEIYPSVKVIPCAYKKAWVEWKDRNAGGGFVKSHDSEAILKETTKNEKNQDILKNGNSIATTAYHYVLLVKDNGNMERAVIGMTSTQLKRSRRWNTQIMSMQLDINGKKITPPMFSHTYDIATELETKDKNSWYSYMVYNPKLITDAEKYMFARKFHEEISKGSVKVTPPAEEVAEPANTDENHF